MKVMKDNGDNIYNNSGKNDEENSGDAVKNTDNCIDESGLRDSN